MHREQGHRGLAVLAIDIQEDAGKVAAWVRQHDVTFTVLLDEDGAVARAYKVTGTPTVFLLRPDGTLAGKVVGTRDWSGPAGRALIRKLAP